MKEKLEKQTDCKNCERKTSYEFRHNTCSYTMCKECLDEYIKNRYTCGGDENNVSCILCSEKIKIL